ncbi:MAG TPA: SDR family oxidoreductase [Gammaproteobacteria bacterium]|jgi:UDP-glucose 4-epimerase|nr:SDR family oxidoreductase [Gammaproteobacteria bacterium]
MKCLVTGGAGFIGSHLTRGLLHQGHDVWVLDNLSTGKRENIESLPIEFIEGDVRDAEQVRQAVQGVDFVFHLAALASVGRSLKDPLATHAVNETGTLTVLDAARKAKVKRVVYAASSSAYGNAVALPKREDAKPAPASPYAVSKLTGEHYCRVYWEAYGLETACVRYFNVFGPRQDPNSEYAAVIPRFIDTALNGGSPVIYGDGTQSRDFTYVTNAVQATIAAASAPEAPGQVFNVACGERRSLLELIDMLEDLLGDRIAPQFEPERVGDVKHSQADIAKAQQYLGYEPQVPFKEGLKETVDWYRKWLALEQYQARAPHLQTLPGLAVQAGTAAP